MRNSILVRSIAAVSGIVMLASVAACGDNTASNTDSSASTDTKTTEAVSGNFSGAGASSQQTAVEAWIAGFQGTNGCQGRLQPVWFRRWRFHLPDRRHRMGRLRCRPVQ